MKNPWRWYRGLIGVAGLMLAARSLSSVNAAQPAHLQDRLARVLEEAGFTGRVQWSLEPRLGRRLDPKLAEVGRTIFLGAARQSPEPRRPRQGCRSKCL